MKPRSERQRRRLAAIQTTVMVRHETRDGLRRMAKRLGVTICDLVDQLLCDAFPGCKGPHE